jgi:hypothetical protein
MVFSRSNLETSDCENECGVAVLLSIIDDVLGEEAVDNELYHTGILRETAELTHKVSDVAVDSPSNGGHIIGVNVF